MLISAAKTRTATTTAKPKPANALIGEVRNEMSFWARLLALFVMFETVAWSVIIAPAASHTGGQVDRRVSKAGNQSQTNAQIIGLLMRGRRIFAHRSRSRLDCVPCTPTTVSGSPLLRAVVTPGFSDKAICIQYLHIRFRPCLRTAASSPRRSMSELANTFLFVFAGLFPVVNPLATAPIFLSLTTGCQESQRHSLALRVALNSFWLLLGAMLVGSLILEFFGITVPVVRVAGGTLITAMGWRLLNDAGQPKSKEIEADA